MTPYILVIKNVMTPYFSFQKIMTPPVYLGPSFRRKCQPRSTTLLSRAFVVKIQSCHIYPLTVSSLLTFSCNKFMRWRIYNGLLNTLLLICVNKWTHYQVNRLHEINEHFSTPSRSSNVMTWKICNLSLNAYIHTSLTWCPGFGNIRAVFLVLSMYKILCNLFCAHSDLLKLSLCSLT